MGKKADATRRTIHEAAAALFAQRGYRDVSMQEVCDATGLSKGGLYRHYDGKAALFYGLLRSMQHELASQEADARAQSTSARAVLDGFLAGERADLEPPNLNLAVYEFCLEQRQDVGRELMTAQFDRGRAILADLIAYGTVRGEFRCAAPQAAADAILLLLEGLKLAAQILSLPPETVDGVFNQIYALLGAEVAL